MANEIIIPSSGDIMISGSLISGSGDIELGSKTITLNTKDTYVPENIKVTVKAKTTLQKGTLSNQASNSVNYAENTSDSTILPSEGALYINEGWYPATKITLGHMIQDDELDADGNPIERPNAGTNQMLSGYEAFDVDGKRIIGTLATVDPTFKGGDVSLQGTTLMTTPAVVTNSKDGAFTTTTGKRYGVTTEQPDGADGTDYLTVSESHTITSGSYGGTVSATRAEVQYNTDTSGNITKAPGDTALASESGLASTLISGTVAVDSSRLTDFKYYIPIVEPHGDGGVVTLNSGSSISFSNISPMVTGKIDGSISTTSNQTAYGITSIQPTGTDGSTYLTIVPSGTAGDAQSLTATAKAKYDRSNVTAANTYKGAVSMTTDTLLLGGATGGSLADFTGTTNVQASVTNGAELYIPISTHTLTTTSTGVTKPTVTTTGINTPITGVAGHTAAVTYATTSDLGGKYVEITPTVTSTDGKSEFKSTLDVTKGLIKEISNLEKTNEATVGVTVTNSAKVYMKVYDGSYSVA